MQLHDLLLRTAERLPDQVALMQGDKRVTYSELAASISEAANNLVAMGVAPGDRIAVFLNKRIEAVVSYFAISRAGAIFVPINSGLKPPQAGHILRDCGVSTLILAGSQLSGMSEELSLSPDLKRVITIGMAPESAVLGKQLLDYSFLLREAAAADAPGRIDQDPVAILYTSGSTGKPKGVTLSHRNMVAGAESVASYLENDEKDTILAVLPFSFDAGFSQLTTGFASGASIVLLDYLLPRDVLKACVKYRITGITGVPPLWAQLVGLDWPQEIAASMRYLANTGGAMPTATLSNLRSKLPETQIFLMYGLTEAFRSTYLPPDQLDVRPTSIGKAIPNAEILVVHEDGSLCEPGEEGELVHRGALVSLGYWGDRERTAARFKPAPCKTDALPIEEYAVWSGDTVTKDEAGYLYFVGRRDDMIKSSGYRISPTEVEEVVYSVSGIRECAAIGVQHPALGQAVVIVAATDSEPEPVKDAVISKCRKVLPNYMVPANILFESSLKRNNNGKIDRGVLKTRYADLFSRDTEGK